MILLRNLSIYFKNKNIEYEQLLQYGFTLNGNLYVYEKKMGNDGFKVIIQISKTTQISKVIDLTFNEEYVLVDFKDASGDFVLNLKKEYEAILEDIVHQCTTLNIFKSKQAKQIIQYVKEKYQGHLEYLWEKFPNNAIWRNKINKWYGALLVIPENKLGIESEQIIEIIDLRYQKDQIKEIVDHQKIFAGYHMNKNSWITIKLDGSVELKEIYRLIDNSYQLSFKK